MTDTPPAQKYPLEFDEKVTPVMVYTRSCLAWGDVITKQVIRLSTWLRTPMAPLDIGLLSAQMLLLTGGSPTPLNFSELHFPIGEVVAFHMLPPHRDPLDFDPSEPNRKLDPVTCMIGPFRFDGYIRVAGQTNLTHYLEVVKETFIPLYEIEISQPQRPSMKPLRIPYTLVRREVSLFATREAPSLSQEELVSRQAPA